MIELEALAHILSFIIFGMALGMGIKVWEDRRKKRKKEQPEEKRRDKPTDIL